MKRFPVERVSWLDCQEFIAKLNEQVNDEGWVYRLPTMAEWEYACRGGPMTDKADSAFDFYFEKPTNTLTPDLANFDETNLNRPIKVGSYAPNRLGLHDMHGNVREWCQAAKVSDKGTDLRGYAAGSFRSEAISGRAAGSWFMPPTSQDGTFGLRLARVRIAGSWRSLFNGQDFTGWNPVDSGSAEVVQEAGQPLIRLIGPKILQSPAFNDYHLRFDYKAEKGAAGGLHHILTYSTRFELILGDLTQPVAVGTNCSYQRAELRGVQFVPVGEPLESKKWIRLTKPELIPKTPWQRVEVIRRGDSAVYLINGKNVGAVTNIRDVENGEAKIPGRAGVYIWAFGGSASYRNIEIREINALPPELANNAAGPQ